MIVLVNLWMPSKYEPTVVSDDDLAHAQAYLSENLAPLPEGWTFEALEFGKKGAIRIGSAGTINAETTIIFVPGYTGAIEMYADFYAYWREKGYRVVAMDLPGQGGSSKRTDNPEKPTTGVIPVYGNAVDRVVKFIRGQASGNVIVVGESFGGHAVLRAAADHNFPADGIVLLVPALEIQTTGFNPAVAHTMVNTANTIGLGSRFIVGQGNWTPQWDFAEKSFFCGDREDRIFMKDALYAVHPEYRVGGATHEWFAGMEKSGKELARGKVTQNVTQPVRIVQAGQDTVVTNNRPANLCANGLADCVLTEIEEASHCLAYEDDMVRNQVFAVIDRLASDLSKS